VRPRAPEKTQDRRRPSRYNSPCRRGAWAAARAAWPRMSSDVLGNTQGDRQCQNRRPPYRRFRKRLSRSAGKPLPRRWPGRPQRRRRRHGVSLRLAGKAGCVESSGARS
jgi:hypothetical protein